MEGFDFRYSQGAYYLFPSIERFINRSLKGNKKIQDDTSFCLQLLRAEHVAVVPGSSFGSNNSIRISYAIGEKIYVLHVRG